MKFYDILRLSLNSLMHRKLRSCLTVLGIVIGVAAIVALVSIGEGLQANVKSQLSGMGANTITISASMTRAMGGFEQRMEAQGAVGGQFSRQSTANLTESDLRIVKATTGVEYATGIISGREEVSYLGQKVDLTIEGVDESVWKYIETTDLSSGRYLNSGDTYSAVIGYRVATEIFKQEIAINRQISIGGKSFKVVGILKSASPDTEVTTDTGGSTGSRQTMTGGTGIRFAAADAKNQFLK